MGDKPMGDKPMVSNDKYILFLQSDDVDKYAVNIPGEQPAGQDKFFAPPKTLLNRKQRNRLLELLLSLSKIDKPKAGTAAVKYNDEGELQTILNDESLKGGSRRRRHSIPKSSRKFKKSSKRVFRKKSRSTRRR
jgi:hypothetical protein